MKLKLGDCALVINKSLFLELQIKRQSHPTCQAFVDWSGELGQQASEDLDDESKDILKIRIEKFQSTWDVFINKIEDFSQNNAEVCTHSLSSLSLNYDLVS